MQTADVEIRCRLLSNDGETGRNPFGQFVDDVSAEWRATGRMTTPARVGSRD